MMSPPLLAVDELGPGNGSLVTSPASVNSVSQNGLGLKERNYLGLSDCSSVDSSVVSGFPEERKSNLNLKATELRLGLPGSQSPKRDSGNLDEQSLFPLLPSKDGVYSTSQNVSGNKRGFSDTMDRFPEVKSSVYTEENWMFCNTGSESDASQSVGQKNFIKPGMKGMLSCRSSVAQPNIVKEGSQKVVKERAVVTGNHNQMNTSNGVGTAPAAKAQVVGWPPIRSFRKNSLAAPSKTNEEVDGKPGPSALFIKVSMDGAPYLRKIDLRAYTAYQELSSGLEKMFSCFTIGQCGSNGAPGREMMSESKLRDLLHGSEYVLTYEDKDGDWMLVGDVPWEMFTETCKKLKIMKSSDAIGLAPKGTEKTKHRN